MIRSIAFHPKAMNDINNMAGLLTCFVVTPSRFSQ